MLLKIAMRVIARRMETGEELEAILATYPKLNEPEKEMIRAQLAPVPEKGTESPEEG